ncbi:hypothetical protein BESB_080600 [Besnoitia besnoiti]|uniref:Atg6 BARA domain-containing protein n=1 Tax=Besnoitia besnoiti TaxID=94643 RepID=A0A2A9M9G3_BESBE|nr:hypothetical protein BESB_080600 [Besnoitia besnoiti]PFH33844.1 hypothetical protein BESB_080600 [Besnoitia besnoiti]
MATNTVHRCVDCAAPLVFVHDSAPPACLLPAEVLEEVAAGASRRIRGSSPPSTQAAGLQAGDAAGSTPDVPSSAAASGASGSDLCRTTFGLQSVLDAEEIEHPRFTQGDGARTRQPSGTPHIRLSDLGEGGPLGAALPPACAPVAEAAGSPSLQDSFVLLSPLPGTQAPSSALPEEEGAASSPAASGKLRPLEASPGSSSSSSWPAGSLSERSAPLPQDAPRQQFVESLLAGEGWTQLVLDDAALCAKCLAVTVGQLEQQLEEERALLCQYSRALRRLKKHRRQEAARQRRDGETANRAEGGDGDDAAQRDEIKTPRGAPLGATETETQSGAEQPAQGPSASREGDSLMPSGTVASRSAPDRNGEAERAAAANEELSHAQLAAAVMKAHEEFEEGEEAEEQLLEEIATLELLQLQLWFQSSAQQDQVAQQEEATAAMLRERDYVRSQVRRLKQLNVMNDAFHIWTDGALPSINSCRVGRLASPAGPSWTEINTGWGHMCLLLDVLFRKVYVHPTHYRLLPRGPYSCLIRRKDDTVLPLQGGTSETGLSRFFYSNRRFDAATAAFLECVQELYEALVHFARQPWPPYASPDLQTPLEPPELPFAIDGDRVGGLSVRLQLSQDERWSKAVKYLLIDLKWLLGYVEKVCVVLPSVT